MAKIYSTNVIDFKVGSSPYYVGNSFLDFAFPDFMPPISVIQDAKPYGFLGHPEPNTSAYIINDVTVGYLDTRAPFKATELSVGGCMLYTPSTSVVLNKGSIGIYSANTSMAITESNYDIQVQDSIKIDAGNSIEANAGDNILLEVQQSILAMKSAINKWGCGAGLIATPEGVAYAPSIASVALQDGMAYAPSIASEALQDGMALATPLKSVLDEVLATFTSMVAWMNSHSHPSNGSPPKTLYVLPTYWNTTYPTDISNLSTMP